MIKWIIVGVVIILIIGGVVKKMSHKVNPKDLFSGPMLEVAQAVYQTMLQIKEKLISQGVQFPVLSPWGERFVRDIVFCEEPLGYHPRSECKVEGVNQFVKDPLDEVKCQDEAILKQRYGIERPF